MCAKCTRHHLKQDKNIQDLPGEIWKPVTDFEDIYEVSNFGRVRSLERYSAGYMKRKLKAKIMTASYAGTYCCCYISKTIDGVTIDKVLNIIKEMAIQFNVPNPNNYTNVILKDGNVYNITIDNIEWVEFQNAGVRKECVDMETGKVYKCLADYARYSGMSPSTITNALRRGGSVKGKLISYADWDRADVLLPPDRQWKHVTYKGIKFIVSDKGDIVKDALMKQCKNGIIQYQKPIILNPQIHGDKLYAYIMNPQNRRVGINVKTLMAEAWVPNPNKYHFVKQIDGDIYNLCPSNLQWVSSVRYVNK